MTDLIQLPRFGWTNWLGVLSFCIGVLVVSSWNPRLAETGVEFWLADLFAALGGAAACVTQCVGNRWLPDTYTPLIPILLLAMALVCGIAGGLTMVMVELLAVSVITLPLINWNGALLGDCEPTSA